MAKVKIPNISRLRKELHYSPKTGQFCWLNLELNRRADNAKRANGAGYVAGGYLKITFEGTLYLAHRLAFVLMTGRWPRNCVDHIDGNSLNNKWANLRDVTHRENCRNHRKLYKNNTSGHTGVYKNPHAKSWIVRAFDKHVSNFKSKEDAITAAKTARLR
jgi:hypothetical protein